MKYLWHVSRRKRQVLFPKSFAGVFRGAYILRKKKLNQNESLWSAPQGIALTGYCLLKCLT